MNTLFSFSNIVREVKSSLRLALPLIASEMIYALNGFFATVMIAHQGRAQLGANALVWGVYIAVILFFIGVLSAVSIMVSHSYGAEDNHGVAQNFKQGIILAVVFALPMMIIMWFSSSLLGIVGQSPVVIYYAKPFFHSLIWGMLPLNLLIVMEQFLVGISRPKWVMWASIIQVPVQIFFYYVFLFGRFGFPKLGLAGIGYGLLISYSIGAAFFVCYLSLNKDLKIYNLFNKWWKVNGRFLFEMFRVGAPLGFVYCIEVALFAVVAFMMGRLGTVTLAAYQIGYQYWMIGLTLLFALTQATTVRVGHEVGRGNRDALRLAAFVNIGIGVVFMLMFCVVYIGFPLHLIAVDLNVSLASNQPLVQKAVLYLSIISVLLLCDSVRLLTFGALRGIKDTRFPVIASVVGFWCIAFPLSYISAFKLSFGGEGIWWSIMFGLLAAAIILVVRFIKKIKQVDLTAMVTK